MNIEDYSHLTQLLNEASTVAFGTKRYWELRATYLEKHIDPTYSDFERNNCREFYKILVNKQS